MSAAAMVNIITKNTTKEQMMESYKNYPDTTPKGQFENIHASTVEPILCEIPEGSRVLDVGCNSGALLELLGKKLCHATGIDVSEPMVDLAKKRGLDAMIGDAEEIPFPDATFDVVVLREVLVHLLDPVKALKEISRVLKPSGFLLGSAPHANLERHVWDDKRLHHRYYDEKTLLGDLDQVFEKTHLRVLNGAQFALGFALSHLRDKPAELLWKSGKSDLPPWEFALTDDKETLRVWMGPTQPNGCAYYRMIGFAEKMRKLEKTEIAFESFDWRSNDNCAQWQTKLLMNKNGEPTSALALNHFEKCLKVANPWIFQVTYHEDILTLFEAMKEAYPEKKLITEVDDWLFDLPAYNVASHPYRPNSPQEKLAHEQLAMSDALIVSTSFLKENLRTMFPDKPIHVVPNSIDFEVWDNIKATPVEKGKGVVRIGYTGCANHGGDMEIVKPVLLGLLEEFQNLEVFIAQDTGTFKDVKHPRLKVLNTWAWINDYPAMVKSWDLDIGIAPLRDNNFNRAKSNLRWLEYSALKVPTVASNVRPFSESIKPETGVLCSSKKQWYDSLKELIQDKDLRSIIGVGAYQDVKERFNMDKVAVQYAEILKGLR